MIVKQGSVKPVCLGDVSFLLGAILMVLLPFPVFGMGMDFGGGDEPGEEAACTPDDPLVIIPGPIGSPLRLAVFDSQTYLVADYSRKYISWFDHSGNLTPFFETLGKPLSVAIDAQFKVNGKLKQAYYYLGNDDARTIDVYHEKNDQFYMVGQYPVSDNGVQALDMVFDTEQKQLFVVDGLAREVKVLQSDGQLLRSFGGGVLSDPKGLSIDFASGDFASARIYVSDYGNPVGDPVVPASILIFDMTGSHVGTISGSGRFSRPQGLAFKGDKVYLADNMLAQILEFDRETGVKTSSYGCKGSSAGHLLLPMDVVLGDAGQSLYIADNRNMRITVLPLTQP